MKKAALAVAVFALLASATAFGAATPGKYSGTIWSVLPELKDKPVTMTLTAVGNKNVATVKYEGGEEVWTWDDKVLDQQEIVNGKATLHYVANLGSTPNTYNIHCTDKAANKCDADVDSRNNWTLTSTPNSITYVVNGVDPKKKGDATAKVEKRHEFKFTLAN